jgi:mannose-6-phosphate isomerase-like protein (cupin superfamily)
VKDFPWQTRPLSSQVDTLAPDGSEIRLLAQLNGASMVHCTLPVGGLTLPVEHRTVEEAWYFLAGTGQVWRCRGELAEVVDVSPGMAITIPRGTRFQFRTTGSSPLTFVIATTPPWPGEDEAMLVAGPWPVAGQ